MEDEMNGISVNLVSVLVAAIASFAFGAVWYMSLGKQWMAALGKTEEQLMPGGKQDPMPYIITLIMQLIMAWFLAGLILHLGPSSMTAGLTAAFFSWLAFVVTTQVVNHRFSRAPWSLTLIDCGHWLGVFLVQGAILGWWNSMAAA
jgi:hypothetical protein